jgi:RimJ/RimL family protein N-acetyltransferase
MEIRVFEHSDREQVVALWNDVFDRPVGWNEPQHVIDRKRKGGDGLFFVGVRDGGIVATVMAGFDGVRGWIYALAVHSNYRRLGLGSRILDQAELQLASRGCDKVNLQVHTANSDVLNFYDKRGYSVEARASLGKPLSFSGVEIVDPVPTLSVNEAITLSQITWDDKPAYMKHLNETNEFWLGTRSLPFPYTAKHADDWLGRVSHAISRLDCRRDWAIRNSDGELIGAIGVFNMKPSGVAELGYWLAKPYWRHGWMTLVVKALCEFVFETYDIRRLTAGVFPTNPASGAVLRRAGFTHEGTLRNHYRDDQGVLDLLLFGRLKEEPAE